MPLYPSLEDMKVDQLMRAQSGQPQPGAAASGLYASPGNAMIQQSLAAAPPSTFRSSLYPNLSDYMGLDISVYQHQQHSDGTVSIRPGAVDRQVVAPITSSNAGVVGVLRAEIKSGIRPVVLCKDGNGKIGLVVRGINKGVFVVFVHANSPAALAGLRFGDQILEINGEVVAGFDTDKVMKKLKNAPADRIEMAIRDRPYERTITMQKDSRNHIGFEFKEGKITNLVKDSSAARNGVLVEHNLIEVNGQNVVGLKDKDIIEIVKQSPCTTTITVMPSFIFSHMIKCIGSGLIRKSMDHSIPEI